MEEKKSCLDKRAIILSVFFRNSFVTSFILTRMYVIRTLQIRIKIMLIEQILQRCDMFNFYQFYIMYLNQVCMHLRSDIGTILI